MKYLPTYFVPTDLIFCDSQNNQQNDETVHNFFLVHKHSLKFAIKKQDELLQFIILSPLRLKHLYFTYLITKYTLNRFQGRVYYENKYFIIIKRFYPSPIGKRLIINVVEIYIFLFLFIKDFSEWFQDCTPFLFYFTLN